MPKKKRDYAKRNAAYALQSSDRVMERLLELQEMFNGHPSNYYALLEQMVGMQFMTHQIIEKFCLQLWGKVPANLERWTGTGREHTNRVKAARKEWQGAQDDDNGLLRQVSEELPV
ncbi:hypothetical protein LCGC14_0848000 [marine sediment metagenome]|uniref:Uncharacterized protein n=1 Tax=marine sediment metagenome TaxID=412755 RepID=A0A0F9PFX0_9ZZZZ